MGKGSSAKKMLLPVISGALLSVFSIGQGLAQEAPSSLEQEYAAILQSISDLELTIAYREVELASQAAEIEIIESQIASVDGLKASVDPMLKKMAAAITNEIQSDIPFNAQERFDRLGAFQDVVSDAEAMPAEKMRRAFNIFNAEVAYGQTVEAYAGENPVNPGRRLAACRENAKSKACALSKGQLEALEKGASIEDLQGELDDGRYLRYGRLALAFLQVDDSEAYRFDPVEKSWIEVSGREAAELRRDMKMASGEAAPAVVEAPVLVAN